MNKFLIILGLLLGLCTSNAQSNANLDEANFLQINEFINNGNLNYATFEAHFPQFNRDHVALIFYGFKKVHGTIYGKNMNYSFNLGLHKKGEIFYIHIYSWSNTYEDIQELHKNKSISSAIKKHWKTIDEMIHYKHIDQKVMNRLKSVTHKILGSHIETQPINAHHIKAAYNTLSSPMNNHVYGNTFVTINNEPKGRKAIELLKKEQRYDLIRNILRSYNPVGRAYALEALITLKEEKKITLTEGDIYTINRLIKIPYPIYSIVGSLIGYTDYKAIAQKLNYIQ